MALNSYTGERQAEQLEVFKQAGGGYLHGWQAGQGNEAHGDRRQGHAATQLLAKWATHAGAWHLKVACTHWAQPCDASAQV